MREKAVSRLSTIKISVTNAYYLHYKYLFADLAYAINKYAHGHVLDIGCGNKPYEELFKEKATGYTGCDIVQSSLNKVDVISEATNIPLNDQSFDTVFSTQTIEHVADHNRMILEAHRLLKDGGNFILAGPFNWPIHEEPYDYFRFTKYGFIHLLEKSNFKVLEVLPNGGAWANLGQMIINTVVHSGKSNFFLSKLIKLILIKFKTFILLNLMFSFLDKKDFNSGHPTNYVVIAQKTKSI